LPPTASRSASFADTACASNPITLSATWAPSS
jgi:hypothetical protein